MSWILKKKFFVFCCLCLISLSSFSCAKKKDNANKTYIIVSDIHLGDQRSINEAYGWNLHQKDTLMAFMDYIIANKLCNEFIIAGDLIDEWVAPPAYPAFADQSGNILTEREFFRGVVNANRNVFNKFAELKNSGVKLVYVSGNHDMQVTEEDFDEVLPGLFTQARTAGVEGMGEYSPVSQIFIEHGHRYDILNAPYIGKNGVDGISGSILPPGYFVSKLDCGNRMENKGQNAQDLVQSKGLSDISYNIYWEALALLFGREDVATMTDGMTQNYPFDDYAFNTSKLYNGIDDLEEQNDGWSVRCQRNKAKFVPTVTESLLSGVIYDYCDKMGLNLLDNTDLGARIVVWGHSHDPKFLVSRDSGEKRVHVNTGCWVDGKIAGSENTATFCKITVRKGSLYTVSLCRFYIDENGQGHVEELSTTTLE